MNQNICPHCGEVHPTDVRFCPKTGQPIPVTQTCQHCGAPIEADWLACANCGKQLRVGTTGPGAGGKKKITLVVGGVVLIVALVIVILVLQNRSTPEPVEIASSPTISEQEEMSVDPSEPSQAGEAKPLVEALPHEQQLPVLSGTPVPWPREAISIVNANEVRELARWGRGTISEVAYSPDGQLLAVGTSTGIYFYDADSLAELPFIDIGYMVTSLAFSPDGEFLASGSDDGTVKLWRVSDWSDVRTLRGYGSAVISLAFSPDGAILASATSTGDVKLWQVSDWSELQALRGHTTLVYSLAFSPDGAVLASGSWGGTIRLWGVGP